MINSSFKKFVKKAVTVAGLCAVALPSAAIWTVQDGKILDPNGQPFIFRGITVDHLGAPDKAVQAIKDAAAAGANAVQVEIGGSIYSQGTMITGEQLRSVIQACKDSKVVCVLEPNNVAGYPNVAGAVSPDATQAFWSWPGIREAIAGQQDYVIIGMGNQALADLYPGEYTARMQSYVGGFLSRMPGFMIMIDGSDWGQDTNKEMQAFAARNSESTGPYKQSLIYSVEMFSAYTNPEKVRDYIATFAQSGAPLVIGGFAPTPYYHPHDTRVRAAVYLQLPAASVMEYAQQYGAGYFAWNWSGSSLSDLNLTTNWDANTLTAWGELAINGANGIKATAKRATHFSNSSSSIASSVSSIDSSSSSSSSVANHPPVAGFTTSIIQSGCNLVLGQGFAFNSKDPDGDTLTYRWDVQVDDTVETSTGITVSFAMPLRRINYTVTLTVSDGKGGTSTVSKILSHSFSFCATSASTSSTPSSSSVTTTSVSSSSVRPSSISSSSRSSSSIAAKANCSYVIGSQWGNGFTAAIRVKNTGTQTLNGWSVNWQYSDGSKVTNSWNASLSGSNPYNAKNVGWNANIQPGQTVEFGFQGSKPAGAAAIPAVTGSVCQ